MQISMSNILTTCTTSNILFARFCLLKYGIDYFSFFLWFPIMIWLLPCLFRLLFLLILGPSPMRPPFRLIFPWSSLRHRMLSMIPSLISRTLMLLLMYLVGSIVHKFCSRALMLDNSILFLVSSSRLLVALVAPFVMWRVLLVMPRVRGCFILNWNGGSLIILMVSLWLLRGPMSAISIIITLISIMTIRRYVLSW